MGIDWSNQYIFEPPEGTCPPKASPSKTVCTAPDPSQPFIKRVTSVTPRLLHLPATPLSSQPWGQRLSTWGRRQGLLHHTLPTSPTPHTEMVIPEVSTRDPPPPRSSKAGRGGGLTVLSKGQGYLPHTPTTYPPVDATLVVAVGAAPLNVGQEAGVTTSHPDYTPHSHTEMFFPDVTTRDAPSPRSSEAGGGG